MTHGVFNDGDRTVELFKAQQLIKPHGLTGGNMVDDDAVLYGINVHSLPASFKSFKISAMRIYLP